jgi:hypothetical protein
VFGPWQAHVSRCGSHSKHVHYVLPHKQNIVPPTIILLCDVYGVRIHGMLLAGKLQVWKQCADFHLGLGV